MPIFSKTINFKIPIEVSRYSRKKRGCEACNALDIVRMVANLSTRSNNIHVYRVEHSKPDGVFAFRLKPDYDARLCGHCMNLTLERN